MTLPHSHTTTLFRPQNIGRAKNTVSFTLSLSLSLFLFFFLFLLLWCVRARFLDVMWCTWCATTHEREVRLRKKKKKALSCGQRYFFWAILCFKLCWPFNEFNLIESLQLITQHKPPKVRALQRTDKTLTVKKHQRKNGVFFWGRNVRKREKQGKWR